MNCDASPAAIKKKNVFPPEMLEEFLKDAQRE